MELERGDVTSALNLANQAVAAVEAAIKEGKGGRPFLPTAYQRRARVELQAGRLEAAAADTYRALNQLQLPQKDAPPQAPSSRPGRAYLLLARVLTAQGKSNDARAAAQSAVENLQSTLGPDHPDTRSARQLAEADTIQR